jgi:hypothetical protein
MWADRGHTKIRRRACEEELMSQHHAIVFHEPLYVYVCDWYLW